MQVLDIVVRILHVLSAIGLLGGTAFVVVALLPAMGGVDEPAREKLMPTVRKRFHRIVHPAVVLLLLTGIYQWVTNHEPYEQAGPVLHGVLGVKVLIALTIFGLIFAADAGVLKGGPPRWAKVNLTLGLIVVILAAIVRHLRLGAM